MYDKLYIFKWIIKMVFSGILSVILLSGMCMFYGLSGIHITSTTGANDYTWEPNQRKANMTEGFSWLNMDEAGYNNTYPASSKGTTTGKDVDILLMGSSHMEAVNIASNKNAGYLLNELLPQYTYNIGMSGHTIYNCVNNIKDAAAAYPSDWIVLETADVELSITDMKSVIDGTYPHIKSYDSGVLYFLQKYSPAVKSIYKAVDDWAGMDEMTAEETKEEIDSADYTAILELFLEKAVSSLGDQKILIVYQPKTSIDSSGAYISTADNEYSIIFKECCEAAGIYFLDLSEEFERLYETEQILAHGFCNTAVGEGHMNEAGHRVFAEEAAAVIRKEG